MSERILFIDQTGQLGGAELCLADITAHFSKSSRVLLLSDGPFAEVLRERGSEVRVLPASYNMDAVEKNSGIWDLVRVAGTFPRALLSIRKEARDADLLYLNTPKALILGVLSALGTRKKLVFHLHDLINEEHFSPANIRLLIAAANRAHLVIANSRAVSSAFLKAGGRGLPEVIPNGFDPRPFDEVAQTQCSVLQKQWNPRKLSVVAVFGRIARWKGQDILLRAAAEVPGLMVWVVGAALFTGDDRQYEAELRALAESPELQGRVFFCGHRDDVPVVMKAADIIAHTSVSAEPFGRVVVEGMLAGKPVVASDAGGPSEIIEHGITGWLVPPGNPSALVHRLRQLLSDPQCARDAGERAARSARYNYALSTVIEKTRRVLSPLLPG